MVHTEKDGNAYGQHSECVPLMKGVEAPALFKEKELIDVNSATKEEIDGLPESATQIKATEEYQARFMTPDEVMDNFNPF